jgi:DNA primase
VLDDSLPKYLNSPQTAVFDKSGTIYGIDMAGSAIRNKDMVVIVEGYMDVIIAHQYGFTNVVASMGTAITEKHITILKKLTKNIALALDPDAAGEEAMLRCVEYENSMNTEVKVIILPSGKDPDEVIKEDPNLWQQLVGKALPVIDYTIDMTVSRQDMSTASAKSQVANNLLSIIARVSDDIRRDHYLTKLSKLAAISYNKLEGVLKTYLKLQTQRRGTEPPVLSFLTTVSSPREEYCLALLLQHPELKKQDEGLQPDYFQNIVNREIYCACLETDDVIALKERLEPAVREKLEVITTKHTPTDRISAKYTECVLALHKAFLLNQEAMRAEVFAMEAETGGTSASLAKLKEEGIEPSIQLKDVFARKPRAIRRTGNGSRRNT